MFASDCRSGSWPNSFYGFASHLRVPGPVLVLFPHTPRVDPDQTVSASGQGKGINRGGAPNPQGHRGPIQVWITRRKFEWEGSQSVPTHCFITATGYTAFRGSISRSRDTSFQRPLDTRRHRVNKIEGEEDQSRRAPTHRTPRPPWPCPVWVEPDDHERSTRTTRCLFGLPTGRLTHQALVSASITSDGELSFLMSRIGAPNAQL